jgi:hypothetical protein
MLRRVVEREFEIIGEAISRIEKLDPTVMPMKFVTHRDIE